MLVKSLAILPSLLGLSLAAPLSRVATLVNPTNSTLIARQNPLFSQESIDATLARPALFSVVAYCSPGVVTDLSCGEPCDALGVGDVETLLAGGDDQLIPNFFVSHDIATNSIVVAHQGTEGDSLDSILNNLQILLVEPNPEFFPATVGTEIRVHEGFHGAFEQTAADVLSTVQSALVSTGATRVLTTGHSLGGAIAILDGLMLSAVVPEGVLVETRVFGIPRTGNQEWADFIDITLGDNFSYMTNQNDPVPGLPPQFLGYQHASNEIFIEAVDELGQAITVEECVGQEDEECAAGNSVFDNSVDNHRGPYFNNISFGSGF